MNKFLILTLTALISIGCGSAAQPTANANQPAQKPGDAPIVSSHSDVQTVSPKQTDKNNSTESPMAKPVDVTVMTEEIERAAAEYKKNPKEKEALAKAYFARAFELTDAAQYRAALGDFRKGLKLNPADTDAKAMHDRILGIFKSIGREPPKEGEEPPPLAFKK